MNLYKNYLFSTDFSEDPRTESPNIKKEICKNIFTSSYFRVQRETVWFDTDVAENFEELKNHHPRLFYTIYKKHEHWDGLPFWGSRIYDYVYENESTYDTEEDVFIFRCLVKQRQRSEEISEYFVSEIMTLIFHGVFIEDIHGRFVFSKTSSNENFKVVFAGDSTTLRREVNVTDLIDFECLHWATEESLFYDDVED